jgi:hypothetical protein
MLEKEIEAYLVEQVKKLGGEVRKVKWIGRNGAPDRLVMLPEARKTIRHDGPKGTTYHDKIVRKEQTVWVELKAPGIKAKPHQEREHARMRRMGQRVEVVDSFERVEEILR